MAEEHKEKTVSTGFKVSDRRHFKSDGDMIDDSAPPPGPEPEPPAAAKPPPAEAGEAAAAQGREAPQPEGPLPPAEFLQIVEFLFQNAAFTLGLIPDPSTGKPRVDLQQASHFIDLLAILQDKTKGNLTEKEDQFLVGMIAELRGIFVRKTGFVK